MLIRAKIKLNPEFVLSYQYNKTLPMDNLMDSLENVIKTIENQSFIWASVTINVADENTCKELVLNEFKKLYPDNITDISVEVEVISGSTSNIIESIDSLVGFDEYKKICHEIYDVAEHIKGNNAKKSFLFQNFLFSVNKGYGLTTALEKLQELVESLDLFTFNEVEKVYEFKLTKDDGYKEFTFDTTIEMLNDNESKNRLINIDISNYIEKSKHQELKDFLLKLVPLQEDYIFSFTVPFLEKDALKDIRNVLSDVLFIREISVAPFSNEQIKECVIKSLEDLQYSIDDEALEIFFARINEEKSDGRFYGVRTVNKIVYEMIWLKAKACVYSENTDSKLIKAEDIKDLSSSFNVKQKDGFDELNELIGMEEISERVREIVSQVKLTMTDKSMDKPCLHMRFEGAPGTGKTTVARIIGRIFRENGILRNGQFFEYEARSLCGEFVGQTAPRTAAICRDAYGSVLFIDEAYALYAGDERSNDYGKEALTTLISEMETHRDDMVVIMAGYKDDMKTLMEANAGLRSRMPYIIEFKSYTNEQLFNIFMLMVKKHFKYTEEFEQTAKTYFENISDDYRNSKEFANARFVRNLYERTWSKGALRTSLMNGDEIVLAKEDFEKASAEKEFSEKLMIKRKLGF